MRVAHIITGIGEGGAQAVLSRLCLNDPRNEHTVICMMQEARYGRLLAERGVRVIYLGMLRGKLRLGPLVRLWRLLRQERFDVVQTWMYHADLLGGLVSRLAGVPRVCWGIRHSGLVPGESPRSTIAVARLCARLSPWLPHRSEEHTSELQSRPHLVCRLLLEKTHPEVLCQLFRLTDFSST